MSFSSVSLVPKLLSGLSFDCPGLAVGEETSNGGMVSVRIDYIHAIAYLTRSLHQNLDLYDLFMHQL